MLLFCSRAVNKGFDYYGRASKFVNDVYRLWSSEDAWVINGLGVFVNSSNFSVCRSETLWVYSGNRLYRTDGAVLKKLPILSCVFTYDGIEVSMDEFLEDLKTEANVPLPVLMAAFTINQNKLHPWLHSTFEAYLRNGDSVKFEGNQNFIPSLNSESVSSS